jgi:hypothetical protein
MNGASVISAAFVGSAAGYSATVADCDGDGRSDILLKTTVEDPLHNCHDVGLWMMNGSTIVSGQFLFDLGGSPCLTIASP